MNLQKITRYFFAATFVCVSSFSFAQSGEFIQAAEDTSDVRYNQYGAKVDYFGLKAESQNNILVIENKEKNFKFWLDNRVQMDGATYFGLQNGMVDNDGNPYMAGGVSLRRVRMAVKAQVSKYWYGELDLNFSNGVFELEDAIVAYAGIPGVELKAGNFKEDFSMEETTTSRYTTFMERAMVVAMFAPGRHVGISAGWHRNWLRASAGISWQLVDNASTRLNVEEMSKIGKGIGANYTGKIVFMPWESQVDYGLHLGYNVSYRSGKKVDDNTSTGEAAPRGYNGNYFSTRNATAINRTKFISAEYYGVDYDLLQGAEFAGYYKGFRFASEFIFNNSYMDANSPILNVNTNTKKFWGFYAQASYLLFGGSQRYDSSQSEFTQPIRGKKWGDVELMFRYDYVNLNSEDVYGGSGENYAVGVVYHINNNVKFMVNYQYSRDDKYANNKGKAIIGKTIDGIPTSNPKEAASDFGVRFSTLQARIEIDF